MPFLNKTFGDKYIEKLIKIRFYSLFTSMMEQNYLADGPFKTDSFMAFKTTVLESNASHWLVQCLIRSHWLVQLMNPELCAL